MNRLSITMMTLCACANQPTTNTTRQSATVTAKTAITASAKPSASALATPTKAERRYLLFKPPAPTDRPLIIFLHGYGATPEIARDVLSLDQVAKNKNVIIAAPTGTPDRAGALFWNATPACCDFDGRGPDDVRAVSSVIAEVSHRHKTRGTYVIGFSNGGFMAHRMACDAAQLIEGIAAFAGVGFRNPTRCKPARAIHMLHIHGTNDKAVPYQGGHVLGKTHVPAHPSATETFNRWVKHNRCTAVPDPAPPFKVSGRDTLSEVVAGCTDNKRVMLWTVQGGGHGIGTDQATLERAISALIAK